MPNRNSMSRFAVNPEVHIERSRFNMDSTVKFTGNTGKLIPFYLAEVLPGDTFDISTSLVCRLQTLIHPIMDNLYLDTYYFFCPNRLVWDNWQKFCGEPDKAWVPEREYTVPQFIVRGSVFEDSQNPGELDWDEFCRYFKDRPLDYLGGAVTKGMTGDVSYNALPLRAYAKIYDDWFRDENLQDPLNLYTGDLTAVWPQNGWDPQSETEVYDSNINQLFSAMKLHDYFTSALPQPQRGDPVNVLKDVNLSIPSSELMVTTRNSQWPADSLNNARVIVGNRTNNLRYVMGANSGNYFLYNTDTGTNLNPTAKANFVGYLTNNPNPDNPSPGLQFMNLAAQFPGYEGGNLSLTINDLRLAFQVQKFMEKSARGGARYIELLKSMFGVTSPDSRLQRTEYLGGHRIPLNIHQIVNQTETVESPLGNVGAMSLTADSHSDFVHSFVEHGYIIGLAVVRYKHSYSQGVNRLWQRKTKFDYYWPVFANIGEQPIKTSELYYESYLPGMDPHPVFGYQEAWADYRYIPDRVAGEMRPGIPNSLASWHLGDYYESAPYLQAGWMAENSINVDRTLAVSSAVSDQLLFDVYIKNTATRPMPVYSIPGLADHH